jgi:diaminopimelate epimerase
MKPVNEVQKRIEYSQATIDGLARGSRIMCETLAGEVMLELLDERSVKVDMGAPVLAPRLIPTTLRAQSEAETDTVLSIPIVVDGGSGCTFKVNISAIGMGNPHAIVLVAPEEDLDAVDVDQIGSVA